VESSLAAGDSTVKIIITGGSGFVGRELIQSLLQHHEIINIDLVPSGIADIEEYVHDLTKNSIPLTADFCFHLASAAGGLLYNQSSGMAAYNMGINRNVAEMCKGRIPLLFVSTLNVFENANDLDSGNVPPPTTPYAQSKWEGDQYFVNQYFPALYIVRPSNLFGKSQIAHFSQYGESHVIPDLLQKIGKVTTNEIEVWGDGTQKRNFLHVKDFVNFIVSFLLKGYGEYEERNICSNITMSIGDLVQELLKYTGKKCNIKYNPLYMSFEHMFIDKIQNQIEVIGEVESITEGLKT